MIAKLITIANKLDEKGHYKLADKVDEIISSLLVPGRINLDDIVKKIDDHLSNPTLTQEQKQKLMSVKKDLIARQH